MTVTKERKSQLREKGSLCLAEAAEFLGWSPQTMRNRISQSKDEPGRAPRRIKDHRNRWVFLVKDLEAWEKQNSTVHEAYS